MKYRLIKFISGLFLLVFITLTASCALTVSEGYQPRHRTRVIWVSGVSYQQVYYVQDHNVVIVSQEVLPPRPHKHHWYSRNDGDSGNHGDNGNHGNH